MHRCDKVRDLINQFSDYLYYLDFKKEVGKHPLNEGDIYFVKDNIWTSINKAHTMITWTIDWRFHIMPLDFKKNVDDIMREFKDAFNQKP